ncbi:MAG: flagellar biosynthesis anti-sigma factor FlgM [Firmicutes bacterium]|nr:flagellar biosynthesis anti-sigma factor FlgM [Bacillota bacterium]
MIVSSQQIQMVLRLYGVRQARGAEEQRASGEVQVKRQEGGDRAELSEEALFYRRALEAARKAPEVREERIQRIKEALESGAYAVPAEVVAEKMLGRFLIDYLV